jgi:hypothetical protein
VLDINTGWKEGTVRAAFDLMLEPQAQGFFEMRAGTAGAFAAGPLIGWDKGSIYAGNSPRKKLTQLTPGKWLRVEITAQIGAESYQVKLTQEDGSVQETAGLPLHKTWRSASYCLFSSGAAVKTSYSIDNLSLKKIK